MSLRVEKPEGLPDCISFYIEDCLARGQSDSTGDTKEYLLEKFVTWCSVQGVNHQNGIKLETLELYRRHLYRYRKPRTGEPLSIATQRMRLMAVTGFLKCLHYHEIIESDFYKKFDLPRVPRKLPKQIPEFEEVELLMRQTLTRGSMGLRDRAILELLYASGTRRCEIANLDIGDVDFKNEVITIRKGKGSLDRVVPVAERALYWVTKYLRGLRPGWANLESGEALFLGRTGKRVKTSALTDMVHDYILRSGISKTGACHLLRHATATHMHRNGADIRLIQEFLGHQDLKSTQIYTHVTVKDLKDAYRKTHPLSKLP